MPEAEDEEFSDSQLEETLGSAVDGDVRAAEQGGGEAEASAAGSTSSPAHGEGEGGEAEEKPAGPGKIRRVLSWFFHWHPFFFLGAALVLMAIAWRVYPEPEQQYIPPAEELYREGLDRLYRVMNPDLPLRAATPLDEALAARNALLNLFIFHRADLKSYPQFVNPHLLLAEADFHIADLGPELADKHYADAQAAYADALDWETREDEPRNLAVYLRHNYLGPGVNVPADNDLVGLLAYFEDHEEEIAMRRARREEYIRFRQAEADVRLNRPENALPVLERTALDARTRRRDELRGILAGDQPEPEPRRRVFELGPDEYARLPLLLAMANDGLGRTDSARSEYQAFLGSGRGGRERIHVLGRLARIAMEDGRQYASVDPAAATASFNAAVGYFEEIAASPDSSRREREDAVLGAAGAYSALAGLAPITDKTVVDELADAGSKLRSWLEAFAGKPLPERTLRLPRAMGAGMAKTENIAPGPFALPALAVGETVAMAGGEMETPFSRRRDLLESAISRYDRIASANPGTPLGDRAAVTAANESRSLGLADSAEARYRALLDPLLSPEVNLAARLGLAELALDRGELFDADQLILGGRFHPLPLWLTPDDSDWRSVAVRLGNPGNRAEPNLWLRIWESLSPEGREIAAYAASGRTIDNVLLSRFLKAMNFILRRRDFYDPAYFADLETNPNLDYLLGKDREVLVPDEVVWLNRLLLEASLPYDLVQKAGRGNRHFEAFPAAADLDPSGLTPPDRVADALTRLARGWNGAAVAQNDLGERMRMLLESADAYEAAVNLYRADPGTLLPELAAVHERQAETREGQGRHKDALALTAKAGRTYLSVSSRARGSAREMESLLAAADAFFRAGLLERTVESVNLFLERFGYVAPPGSETSMSTARAENLLGRAHWFLGDADKALASFSRNIKRRTPERYKSMYYIGKVMLDQAGFPDGDPALLGDPARPLPELDRDGDPVIASALQAFNFVRQDQNINPTARAWRWSTFDLARLKFLFAERARREAEAAAANPPEAGAGAENVAPSWLAGYDEARRALTEALERYPLRHNGGPGLSVRVEPEDYADLMASRFEAEYMLATSLIRLADGRQDESLGALARAHLANLADSSRYADALFDPALDRFQLNAAVIREAVEGGDWDNGAPLPRTRLGDDEGPTHSPTHMRELLKNSMLLLAGEYFRAAERAAGQENGQAAAEGLYRQAYDGYQALYDRFGPAYGAQAMLGMADVLGRLGNADAAANHYRMAENIARMQEPGSRSDGLLDIGPDFWGQQAAFRLQNQADGYRVP